MKTYFSDMSRARKVWEGFGGAVVSGAICGALATTTLWAYLIALLATVVGGLGAGLQHRTLRGAIVRAITVSTLWALTVMAAVQLSGRPTVEFIIPRPLWIIIIHSIVVTTALTAGVWGLSRRREMAAGRQVMEPEP